MGPRNQLETYLLLHRLSEVRRSGWVHYRVRNPETVMCHMYDAWLFGQIFLPNQVEGSNDYDKQKILNLLLVHDLAESIIGDIPTPARDANPEYDVAEDDAMFSILESHDIPCGDDFRRLWNEWIRQETVNSIIARDIDVLQSIVQYCIYRTSNSNLRDPETTSNWIGKKNRLKTDMVKSIFERVIPPISQSGTESVQEECMPAPHLDVGGIIFDMDGVIFDSESLWREATVRVNAQFNVQFSEEYRQSMCGKDEDSIRECLKNDFSDLDVGKYRDAVLADVQSQMAKARFKPHFITVLVECKSRGLKIALATSSRRERAVRMFESKGIDLQDIFDYAVFGDDVKASKPNPEIFLLASKGLGMRPEECIVIEDSLNGIRAALDGGFNPVMAVDLIEPDSYVAEHGVPVVRDLRDIVYLIGS